jgi:hypothetical protein
MKRPTAEELDAAAVRLEQIGIEEGELRRKRKIYSMCQPCITGHNAPCCEPKFCPCVCHDSHFKKWAEIMKQGVQELGRNHEARAEASPRLQIEKTECSTQAQAS